MIHKPVQIPDIHKIEDIYDNLPPELKKRVTLRSLQNWAQKDPDRRDFPIPIRVLGRYKFYDRSEVIEWVVLWLRATKNYKGINEDSRWKGKSNE